MNLEKPKVKNSSLPKWLSPFVSPLLIDLEVPYPLETSIILLQRLHDTSFWQTRNTRIQLVSVDEDTYHLKAVLSKNRTKVIAEGIVKRWQPETTYISARINIPFIEYFLVGFLLLAWSTAASSRPDYFWLLGVAIVVFNVHLQRRQRRELKRVIETALEIKST